MPFKASPVSYLDPILCEANHCQEPALSGGEFCPFHEALLVEAEAEHRLEIGDLERLQAPLAENDWAMQGILPYRRSRKRLGAAPYRDEPPDPNTR